MRGIAILLVLCHHALDWPRGGFLGVDLFFVLSGFLITGVLQRGITLRRFYWRRLLRLGPALAGLIVVTLLLGWQTFDRQLLGTLTYSLNLAIASGHAGMSDPVGICWSLSIEEQFYLLWPVWGPGGAPAPWKARPATLVGLIAAGIVLRWGLLWCGAPYGRLYYGTDTRCEGLLFGCLIGLAYGNDGTKDSLLSRDGGMAFLSRLLPDRSRRTAGIAFLVLITAAVLTVGPRDPWLYAGGLTLVNLGFALNLLNLVQAPGGWSLWILRNSILRGLGRISYGLYLWHWAFVTHFGPLLSIPLSLVAAITSYAVIERPFLRLKDAS